MRDSTSRSPAAEPSIPPLPSHPDPTAATRHLAWGALACTAIASPTFIAYNVAPSATLLNQAAALIGWGAFLMLLIGILPPQGTHRETTLQVKGLSVKLGRSADVPGPGMQGTWSCISTVATKLKPKDCNG